MSKHTPGQWMRSDTGQVVTTTNGIQIADCRKMWEYRLTDEEANANACLIAAAPDLLTWSKDLVQQLTDAVGQPLAFVPIDARDSIRILKKAIAKAEGKE